MKVGIFIPNANNGFIMSEAAPQYRPTFAFEKELVQKAEGYGMEFALSLVKYRGFGGKTEHWQHSLDSLALTPALAAVTEKIDLIGSVGILAMHPAVTAKTAATIQDIAGGRFMLNIVSGWQKSEYGAMGLWPGDEHYARRYDFADEYIAVCKELWETGRSDFRGDFFQLDDCRMEPRPHDEIRIVCAGSSDRGMRFTAEHGHYNFIFGTDVDALTKTNQRLLAAGETAGRDVKSIASIHCILGDTDAEAEAKVQRYYDGADIEALKFMSGQASLDAAGTTADIISNLRVATFMGAGVLAGTPETVAEKLDAYRDVEGLEGLMVCLDEPLREIDRLGQEVLPKLRSAAPVGV
jgi:pyrimidine oxygenase